ncbi:MAG: hypothetical protein ACYCV6_18770 [Steroidobacteraceae bacterium]
MRVAKINAVLDRLASCSGSGVRRLPKKDRRAPHFSIDFRVLDELPPVTAPAGVHLGRLAHGGIVRTIPGCPRLLVESGWIRCERTGREALVWRVYLRPKPRCAKVLPFRQPSAAAAQEN